MFIRGLRIEANFIFTKRANNKDFVYLMKNIKRIKTEIKIGEQNVIWKQWSVAGKWEEKNEQNEKSCL